MGSDDNIISATEYIRLNTRRFSPTAYELGKGWCTKCEMFQYPIKTDHCPEHPKKRMRMRPKFRNRTTNGERIGVTYY